MICVYCKRAIPDKSVFCPHCGAALPDKTAKHSGGLAPEQRNAGAKTCGSPGGSSLNLAVIATLLTIATFGLTWLPWVEIESIANISFLDSIPKVFNLPEFHVWDFVSVQQAIRQIADNPLIPFDLPFWLNGLSVFAYVWTAALIVAVAGVAIAFATSGRHLVVLGIAALAVAADAGVFCWFIIAYASAFGLVASASLYLCVVLGVGTFVVCVACSVQQAPTRKLRSSAVLKDRR